VGLVIDAVEQWQKVARFCYLRGLSNELSAAQVMNPVVESEAAKALQACCICFDGIEGPSLSCSSSSTHHLCMTCLEKYAVAESESSKQRIAANNGKLSCPGDGCTKVFHHRQLAQHLPDEVFSKLLAAWQSCIEAAAVQTAAEQAQQELARAAAQDEVSRARAHVLDSILTLKCPRCSKAFDDFTGCLALTCSDAAGNGCRAAFCGYCFALCDSSIFSTPSHHMHVTTCSYSGGAGDLFATEEEFNAAQCRRRKRLVQEYLASLPLQLRERVEAAITPDLKGLGIDLHQPEPQQLQLQQQQQQQQGFTFGGVAAGTAAARPLGFEGAFGGFTAPAPPPQQPLGFGFSFGQPQQRPQFGFFGQHHGFTSGQPQQPPQQQFGLFDQQHDFMFGQPLQQQQQQQQPQLQLGFFGQQHGFTFGQPQQQQPQQQFGLFGQQRGFTFGQTQQQQQQQQQQQLDLFDQHGLMFGQPVPRRPPQFTFTQL
jgi:hypothetical protein